MPHFEAGHPQFLADFYRAPLQLEQRAPNYWPNFGRKLATMADEKRWRVVGGLTM
jgi:hypothetical protein